jgi:hypothetical protein
VFFAFFKQLSMTTKSSPDCLSTLQYTRNNSNVNRNRTILDLRLICQSLQSDTGLNRLCTFISFPVRPTNLNRRSFISNLPSNEFRIFELSLTSDLSLPSRLKQFLGQVQVVSGPYPEYLNRLNI